MFKIWQHATKMDERCKAVQLLSLVASHEAEVTVGILAHNETSQAISPWSLTGTFHEGLLSWNCESFD